jgi:hypothetical protein
MSQNPATTVTAIASSMSPFPPSFGNNPWAFGSAFMAVLSISVFAAVVLGWMVRDIWHFRFIDHPRSLAFLFRVMAALCATAAFIRCSPEVVYMSCFGDPNVSNEFVGRVLMVKRLFDTITLPVVAGWMLILVAIYPFVIPALRNRREHTIEIDFVSVWPRIARPALIFVLVVLIASLMAVAKGAGIGQ